MAVFTVVTQGGTGASGETQVAILPDSIIEIGIGDTATGPLSPNCGMKTAHGVYTVLGTLSSVVAIIDAALQ